MASIDVAKLLNKITQDIPGINTVLKALAKWDVSALSDVPDGAMQATTDANNNLTIKKKVSGSYTPVAKLMHDVDKLDGYHASTSATANAIPVRNASGALPGNILGNSATADTATALAAGSVVPVNQGGTGATTASQARANLGVADGADFTTHVATQASPSVEGHIKLDALAADGSNTAAPGGFGLGVVAARRVTDLNTVLETSFFTTNTAPTGAPDGVISRTFGYTISSNTEIKVQILYLWTTGAPAYLRLFNASGWQPWTPLPGGITDSISTTSSTLAASATAVNAVNASAVHITGDEYIAGTKNFSAAPILSGAALIKRRLDTTLGVAPSFHRYWQDLMQDSAGTWISRLEAIYKTDQNVIGRIMVQNKNSAGEAVQSSIELVLSPDGNAYATAPTPAADATSNQIVTASWVSANALNTGDIIASLATSRSGCLLMNGSAVSRTTYAKLFALIGTTFGAGNGTTTFNLPDARGRTMQGANGNLMALLAAGLPNILGVVHIGALAQTGSGALYNDTTNVVLRAATDTTSNSASVNIDASRSSSIYGNSATVQSPAIAVNYFIKY